MKAVAAILKRRFPNLTTEETIGLSCELVDAAHVPSKRVVDVTVLGEKQEYVEVER